MSRTRIAFGRPTEVTNPGDDSRSFLFKFSAVSADLVGTPEEAQATAEHRLIVTVSNNRIPAWRLSDADLIRVLFEIGHRKVAERVKSGTLQPDLRVVVSPETHPAICPYDPARIQQPEGATFEIEIERRMGFIMNNDGA